MPAAEYLAYPFLFLALFFEAFLLVTFLSHPARAQRRRKAAVHTPNVAMVVPCWNEESTIKGTVDSLLALDYPKENLQIVLVNDGSTDNTKAVMDEYLGHPQVLVVHKENGGKHTALNLGTDAAVDAEFIGCLDADSFVAPDALREIVSCFDNPRVAAATPAMSVFNPKSLLERMQQAEYIFGIALRHIIASMNGLYVTPGPFSLYRKSVIQKLGGFRYGHQTEDMEMALRLQREGYEIDNAPRARVYTKTPTTVRKLIKQRTRWTTGFLRNVLFDYNELIGNPHYGTLGILVLPLGFLAVIGGIILFVLALVQSIRHLVAVVALHYGMPLVFSFPKFEWFYFPFTTMMVLSTVVVGGVLLFMVLGKRISQTPGKLVEGMVAYLLLFHFLAPLWLMRAVADMATGTKRKWR